MSGCGSWLNRRCCCRRQSQGTYIYLYSPPMGSSSSLFHCLTCILCGFCLAFILILTAIIIYNMNNTNIILTSKSNPDQHIYPIAKKRQLQDFVNINIDPCENFYDFVCDKWTQEKKVDIYNDEEEYQQKWTRIRHKIHDKLMINMSNSQPKSSENNFSSTALSVSTLYQLCETQSPSLLLDELERYFALFIQQEPYRSYSTLFNQTTLLHSKPIPITFDYNPFFKLIHSTSNNTDYSFSTILRINRRPLPSPLVILPNLAVLNQTALSNLIKFDNDYTKFLKQANVSLKLYEQEYNQNSLIIKRILLYPNYHLCISSLNETNGFKKLIQLLNYFLRYRLRKFNTKLMDKQIRILEKITNNDTRVEHLRRIQSEFKVLENIIPLENQSIDDNSSCIRNLLDKLLDKRMKIYELSPDINFYSPNRTIKYFTSNDWPYLIMLYDHLLKTTPVDTLTNFVFFDYYRHLIYPYYQPHIHRSIDFDINYRNESYENLYETYYPNISCPINSCFDILNCYHSSLLIQSLAENNQISLSSIQTIVENLITHFRLIIEQSDHLYIKEKQLLINELNQIKIFIGHYESSTVYSLPDIQSTSYLKYAQLFSSISYDQYDYSFSIEPIYNPINHTLLLPYGFIYLSNHSIEYPLTRFFLKILFQTIRSNPFSIECLIKSFDDFNSTITDISDEHITYLLFRSRFLFENNIIFDEYLWPFMSANSLIKRFLIDYTANNYCQSLNDYHLFLNNTYLNDDVYLVFHCQQASSIRQSKCSVI
ncbi:unnamed protein product [Adineta steineri]|uniref:Peptidase M13 N-terminal domain-containing protein n=1 Tax=Adineta steineri TaxID=433720 RepID=A0A818XXW6_9BILA|nr:unnamed protein product [Adineta steineri]